RRIASSARSSIRLETNQFGVRNFSCGASGWQARSKCMGVLRGWRRAAYPAGAIGALCLRARARNRSMDKRYERIYAVIAAIPAGRVASYGQIAARAGLPGRARLVGAALRDTPDGMELPWFRVLHSNGTIALP